MNTITIIAILIISIFFTVTFVVVLKSRGPWGSAWTFLTLNIVWLAAVSLWIPPAGPIWLGAPWVDLFATGLLLSFLLSATPGSSANNPAESEDLLSDLQEKRDSKNIQRSGSSVATQATEKITRDESITFSNNVTSTKVKVGGLFWMLLLCLCALIIIGAV